MKRAEAELFVRAIRRTCRGPIVISELQDREKLFYAFHSAEDRKDWQAAVQALQDSDAKVREYGKVGNFDSLIKPSGPGVAVTLELNNWDEIHKRFYSSVFAHADTVGRRCGADFNDIICAHLFDGKERVGICAKCGSQVQFTSPIFELEAE